MNLPPAPTECEECGDELKDDDERAYGVCLICQRYNRLVGIVPEPIPPRYVVEEVKA
jgi:hypothetical protein